MTFTPFVGPLASALGGDREGALLLMWLLYHQDRAGGAVVLTSAQAETDLAMPRSTLYRTRQRLVERGLVRAHRDARAGGTQYLVSTRRLAALMGWAKAAQPLGPKRPNPCATMAQPSTATQRDDRLNSAPKMNKMNKEDLPPTPKGVAPIGCWSERLTQVAPEHRAALGSWLDEYERRLQGAVVRGPQGGRGFFGDTGLFAVRDELLGLYEEAPELVARELPGFWASWDERCAGRVRGIRRMMAHLQGYMTDRGRAAPVDTLLSSLQAKRLD